jgi:hypothetical protein
MKTNSPPIPHWFVHPDRAEFYDRGKKVLTLRSDQYPALLAALAAALRANIG